MSPDLINLKNISGHTFNGHFEFYYDTIAGVRKFHIATDKVTLAPNQSLGPIKVQVPKSRSPSDKFYVIAVDGVTGRAVAVTAFTHNALIDDPTPPQPCNKDIMNSGGYETFSLQVNLGSKKGVSTVYIDTFTIPDTIGIYKLSGPNTRIYYSWTPVSGSHEFKINYDPELFPERGISVTIVGSQPGTEWKVRVTCPQ